MLSADKILHVRHFLVKPGKKVRLREWPTKYKGKALNKRDAEALLDAGRRQLAEIQDKLYAHNQYSVLIILQAMDAAGKDGAVKHIMSGFNPLGVKVYSFKAPNAHELDHDYFWRHALALPARGEIAIHNRSHYENVLATRVHPEWILNENIPGIGSLKDIDARFWESRYKQINRFEKNLAQNGTIIMKFFLHLSKNEQRKRFLERIEDPAKNWKFSLSDIRERAFWDNYQQAYETALEKTSKDYAPWYIIPADDKWYARLAMAYLIHHHFEKLRLSYPSVTEAQKQELEKARQQLLDEQTGAPKAGKKKTPVIPPNT
ncbi:MAG: PPK2 family polyphosphate--nucleotide phosphotransferase [Cyclobacteriaceae bacterium]|nr:MAG: PPK2 family polyphosphate--nucleotide phosphotransferase [Cyclobacteriaceae bacterium]